MKKKVLWFSRHSMSEAQKTSLVKKLGEIEIHQVNKTIKAAYELKADIDNADIIAVVAPINLQQQFLKLAGNKPVISAVSERKIVNENKVEFIFKKWIELKKIEVVTELFSD